MIQNLIRLKRFAVLVLIINYNLFGNVVIYAQTPRGATNKPKEKQTSEKRLALVIGNSNYQFTGKLDNPTNDATDMARTLKELGFEVASGMNLTLPQMRKLVHELGAKLQQQKDIGLFYYAGHGIQSAGRNFLIPVEANIESESALKLKINRRAKLKR